MITYNVCASRSGVRLWKPCFIAFLLFYLIFFLKSQMTQISLLFFLVLFCGLVRRRRRCCLSALFGCSNRLISFGSDYLRNNSNAR